MRRSDKVIISCAITGSIHTPSMSPFLPITPGQIAADAIAAAEAGAAILHLHARDPDTGKPDQSPELFRRFLPEIKQNTNAIINITTGGGLGMSLQQRLGAALWAKPELASLNMGSLNFNIAGAGARVTTFKHDWEKSYLEMTKDFILSNTFSQIEHCVSAMAANGTRFEFECYDVGHLYNLAHFLDRKLVTPPLFIQCIFGVLGGLGADPENIFIMKATADRLFGNDYYLSVLATGRHQFPLVTMGAVLGGNVRVGLEDNLYISKGRLAKSNAEQVTKIRHILELLSLDLATTDEARAMLELKGTADLPF
jgi:uncharacterized protein (DUF849 family)